MVVSFTEFSQWTRESSWVFGTAIKVFENSSERKLILMEWTTKSVPFPLSFILKDRNKASFATCIYICIINKDSFQGVNTVKLFQDTVNFITKNSSSCTFNWDDPVS